MGREEDRLSLRDGKMSGAMFNFRGVGREMFYASILKRFRKWVIYDVGVKIIPWKEKCMYNTLTHRIHVQYIYLLDIWLMILRGKIIIPSMEDMDDI